MNLRVFIYLCCSNNSKTYRHERRQYCFSECFATCVSINTFVIRSFISIFKPVPYLVIFSLSLSSLCTISCCTLSFLFRYSPLPILYLFILFPSSFASFKFSPPSFPHLPPPNSPPRPSLICPLQILLPAHPSFAPSKFSSPSLPPLPPPNSNPRPPPLPCLSSSRSPGSPLDSLTSKPLEASMPTLHAKPHSFTQAGAAMSLRINDARATGLVMLRLMGLSGATAGPIYMFYTTLTCEV